MEHSRHTPTRPSSTVHQSMPISDMQHAASVGCISGDTSSSGWHDVRSGVSAFAGKVQFTSSLLLDMHSSTFFTAAWTHWEELKAQHSTSLLSCTFRTDPPRHVLGGPIDSSFNVNCCPSSFRSTCSAFSLRTRASLVCSNMHS
jgi:hypothetical protein